MVSEGHGWVGGKFYASLADVPCSGRNAEGVRCPKPAADWDGWCAEHGTAHACIGGHLAVDHHGVDPEDGCMAVASHKLPQCPCRKTCPEVVAA